MLIAPVCSVILKLNVALRPSITALAIEKVICDAMRTLSGTTMCSTCLADIDEGDELARSYANLWSAMGLGVLLGPLLAARVVRTTGSPRHAFTASAVVAMTQLVLELFFLEETLAVEERARTACAGLSAAGGWR